MGSSAAATVDSMLADIPQPEGFAAVVPAGNVRDRYQLGAAIAGQVACRWIDSWLDAKRSGDTTAASTAADAMATSHHWAVLQEMNSGGDFPKVLWQYADALTAGNTVIGGKSLTG